MCCYVPARGQKSPKRTVRLFLGPQAAARGANVVFEKYPGLWSVCIFGVVRTDKVRWLVRVVLDGTH